ncbi:MAG: 16S rRNA (cytosine(1402)-N(4))-methyltransferase [Zetaproteobacteria bacterium]|nr:MAG: 16S rRNA (cytosine(1402)-N(4))-methyltransferase [Zetaproteobacteria bacterium]
MAVRASSGAHYPVMMPEVLAALSPQDGGVYVDGTFGAGGYTRAILEAADCTVYAIDRDDNAQAAAKECKEQYGERFVFLRGCFGDVKALLHAAGVDRVGGFVLDVGVSSMQIDEAERGFSFRFDGPLDMRMDVKGGGQTAADIVNSYEEEALANLIYQYGDERKSRHIAHRIVQMRAETPFERTLELAEAVRSVIPRTHKDKIDPATRTFQALRIAVNDELGELDRALDSAEDVLLEGGRLVVVSFHSLEDRRVKRFLKDKSNTRPKGSRHLPQTSDDDVCPVFDLYSRKAIKPSDVEVSENPRSRSARLRGGIRCALLDGAA